jgi:DNA-binding winged helix-turn-helix (wHTH) protein/Tfp pilus assembly protein PilF
VSRERYRIADLLLDVDAVSLRRDGDPAPDGVALPKLSFDLLVALARKAPAVVSADQLISIVWEGSAVSDETLTQRVALLRRALGDDARQPRYLRAVRGRGYQLVPEVVALPSPEQAERGERDRSPGEAGLDEADSSRLGRESQGPRRGALTLVALLALTAIALSLFFVARSRQAPANAEASGDSRLAPLVATRAASLSEILDRAGAYLRQQQRGNNDLAIELYRRALKLAPGEPRALAGLSLALSQKATKFNERGATSEEALALARRAVQADPQLALAHHALALALDSQGRVTPALASYRRAAALAGGEESGAAALASAANLLLVQGHLAEALEMDLQAARVEKNREETPYLEVQIGSTLALLGYEAPALVWFERAIELRPDNVFAATSLARFHLSHARLREADAAAESALARAIRRPELWEIRGLVRLLRGDEPAARHAFGEAQAVAPGYPRARIQLLLLDLRNGTKAGDPRAEGQALLREIREGQRQGDEWPDAWIDEALLEAGLSGDDPAGSLRTFAALDGAIARGYRDAGWLLLEPGFATLRTDARFLRRLEIIRDAVEAERQRIAGAPWLPPGFLKGAPGRAASR